MDPVQQPPQAQQRAAEAYRAEQERRSRDLFKGYNPTNQDHQVILNAAISPEVWTIAANSEMIWPRYVHEKYLDEMSAKIITSKSDKAVIAENEKRLAKGFEKMNLHTEQNRFESRNLKVMTGKKDQIMKVLDRGLYKEYGIERTVIQKVDARDQRSTFDAGIADDVLSGITTPPLTGPAAVAHATYTPPTPPTEQTPIIETPVAAPTVPEPTAPPAPIIEDDDEEEEENG